MTARRGSGHGPVGLAFCVPLLAALGAGSAAAAVPPLLAWSDSAASGTRPLTATSLAADEWTTPPTVPAPGPFTSPGWPLHWKVARTSPDARRTVVLFQEDDDALRDRLWATFWDGAAWSAGNGTADTALRLPSVNGATLPSDHRQFDAAFEQRSGELLVVSGINTDESTVHWTHSGTTWSGYTMTPHGNTQVAAVFDWVRLAPMPGTNRIAFVGLANEFGAGADAFAVHGAIWDGDTNTWGSKTVLSFPTSFDAVHATEAVDVAFTLAGDNAGEAVAVWAKANAVLSATWRAGAGWSPGRTVASLGSGTAVRWLRLAADPGSADMVLAIGDVDGTTGRVVTVPYDGATRSWGTVSPFHTISSFGDPSRNRPFDVAWDPLVDRRNVVLVYSDGSGLWSVHSVDGGTSFGSPRAVDALGPAYWVRLERRRAGEIDLVVHDAADALRAWRWDGYGWLATTERPLSTRLEPGPARDVEPFALASLPPASPAARPGADFDRDGRADVLWRHSTTGALSIWLVQGAAVAGSVSLRPESFADTDWQIRALGDLDRDGRTDVLWHHRRTGELYAWYLDGTLPVGGEYLSPRTAEDPRAQVRGAADFDGDGYLDLLWQDPATGALSLWLMQGVVRTATASLSVASVSDPLWQVRGLVDFDGDGDPDVVWHHARTGALALWRMDGTSVAAFEQFSPGGMADARWRLAEVGDFDGDRRPDLLWHHRATGELLVWFMNATQRVAAVPMSPSRVSDLRWAIAPTDDDAAARRAVRALRRPSTPWRAPVR